MNTSMTAATRQRWRWRCPLLVCQAVERELPDHMGFGAADDKMGSRPAKSFQERSLSQLITAQLCGNASRATESNALILCVARHECGTTSS